jgi:Mn2+/Fe2+ NRAMP family transporter
MGGLLEIALGITSAVGGFIDVGTIATTTEAGAGFGLQLLWAVALGTICVILVTEMCGRLAAVSGRPLAAAIRERFGISYYVWPMTAGVLVDLTVLAAEIGGACVAIELVTGIPFNWWAIPVTFLIWFLLWKFTFGAIEHGVALLGLLTLSFVAGAWMLGPNPRAIAAGLLPSLPGHHAAHYWFVAVSIIGSILSPYVLNFYSSGAVEEKWKPKDLWINRIVAVVGMSFGACITIGVVVCAAFVLHPAQIRADSYQQAALQLMGPLGRPGLFLFAASLFIACVGAALEVALNLAYTLSQALGWNWSENQPPAEDARFASAYTIALAIGGLLMATGLDPLRLTMLAMAFNVVVAPLVVMPLVVLMNNKELLGRHTNSLPTNIAITLIVLLAFVVSVVAIPLEVLGG